MPVHSDETYKPTFPPHNFQPLGGLPWPVCRVCGLVALKNDFTRWCMDHGGCDYKDHPGFAAAMKKYSTYHVERTR